MALNPSESAKIVREQRSEPSGGSDFAMPENGSMSAPVHAVVTGQRVKAAAMSKRLKDVSDLLAVVKDQAAEAAPLIIEQLMKDGVSLREVARRTKLSPTYLSVILNSDKFISVDAFHKLATVYESRNS